MKFRESGMPEVHYWESLFDVDAVLDAFAFGPATGAVAELGCGYGTFTIPLARRTGAPVHAFDIDPAMVEATLTRAAAASVGKVSAVVRDVFAAGYGLEPGSCGACLLFNILHGEAPVAMLREAERIVRHGGMVAVIHWRSDLATPRGPSLEIRPRPEQIVAWAEECGGLVVEGPPQPVGPWHFALRLQRMPADSYRGGDGD